MVQIYVSGQGGKRETTCSKKSVIPSLHITTHGQIMKLIECYPTIHTRKRKETCMADYEYVNTEHHTMLTRKLGIYTHQGN